MTHEEMCFFFLAKTPNSGNSFFSKIIIILLGHFQLIDVMPMMLYNLCHLRKLCNDLCSLSCTVIAWFEYGSQPQQWMNKLKELSIKIELSNTGNDYLNVYSSGYFLS